MSINALVHIHDIEDDSWMVSISFIFIVNVLPLLNRAILVLCRSQKTSQLQKQSGLNAQLSGMSLTGLAAGPILPKSLSNLKRRVE